MFAARSRERLIGLASPMALLIAWEAAVYFGWVDPSQPARN